MNLQQQNDLIFGTLLGDGSLQTGSGGQRWRYRAVHKAQHKPYLEHKFSILKPFCTTPPAYGEVFDERTQKVYMRNYFNTTQQASFKFFADMFYKYDPISQKWRKDVPLQVEKYLTPAALAYFYMDDGALKWLNHSNAMRICTEYFTRAGVERLQKALKNRYNIETNLSKKTLKDGSIGWRIEIPERSSAAFRAIIQPHLVPCMCYKVSDGNRGHL